jgi:cellulose synthase operon protein C
MRESGTCRDTRRKWKAAWLAASLLDAAGGAGAAVAAAYASYLRAHPQPLEAAQRARLRLMELARDQGRRGEQREWLQAIVNADREAAGSRDAAQRVTAARAALQLGQMAAMEARELRLRLPIERSLPAKQRAMEAAIQALNQAVAYGFAEITTAATFELGALYQDFGRALMESERPRNLRGLELEQYDLLLEEQAFPFEEKAIQTHLVNLRRVEQGLLDAAVRQSYQALSTLAPCLYGKREKTPEPYDALH